MECRARCSGEECKAEVYENAYCYEHWRQERGLYRFYKAHEQAYEASRRVSQSLDDDGTVELPRTYYHLNLAVCGRALHADWFYHNYGCVGHEDHLAGLRYHLGFLQTDIFDRGHAIIFADVENTAEMLKEAVVRVGADWTKEDDGCGVYGELPMIQLARPDTPGSEYRPSPKQRDWSEPIDESASWDEWQAKYGPNGTERNSPDFDDGVDW